MLKISYIFTIRIPLIEIHSEINDNILGDNEDNKNKLDDIRQYKNIK